MIMKNILEIGKFKCKKMTTNKKNNNTNAPLLLLLSIISIIGCIALYFAITKSDNTTKESLLSLLKSLIPNVICALLVFPILYYFYKKGISTNIENISISENQKNKKEFISCYKSYHNIKWKEIISSAKVLDIVVIYFDSWAITYRDELINYFKDGGKIRLILMNPDSEFISIAAKRFHENNMTIDDGISQPTNLNTMTQPQLMTILKNAKDSKSDNGLPKLL